MSNAALDELDSAFPRLESVGTALYVRRNTALSSMAGAFAALVDVGADGVR